ncbi:4-hydroxythreonine-4-phosphate dehydrogenase PdxA [Polluticoccus soli]|uniref:4-hydroxythreonine-4-phosphate dehydrogenase PdxA n=1 Tax=Polluticoccus soli TaxID=3034150 RepID=UPI0023E3149E|nr:4-hydroxythreonine-4-phosphate dehydrogenase PdxA [Flavipsychrobacter sp. JY13-12]
MQQHTEKPVIGITTGDLNGIGPELIIKALSDNRIMDLCTPVVFASNKVINFYRKMAGTEMPFNFTSTKDLTKLNPKQVNIFNCWEEEVPLQPGSLTEAGGKYAIRSLQVATQCLKDGQLDAIVTAPIHKSNTQMPDFPYTGHTPFLKDKFGARDVLMLLYSGDLRVGLVTEHVPVAKVAQMITKELLQSKFNLLKDSLIKDFGIDKPRIAILGLNPHAGDNGQIGTEEQTVIKPFIEQLQQQGHLAFGPYGADAFFARSSYTQFDAVLAMYHDQGLIPFKTIAHGEGVNYTAGLPVIRTSPDHGTAFDIAGKGIAEPSSFREAIFQCIDLLRKRKEHAFYTANPMRRGRMEKEKEGDSVKIED